MADGQVLIELKLSLEEFEGELAAAGRSAEAAAREMEQAMAGPLAVLGGEAARAAEQFEAAMAAAAEAAGLAQGEMAGLRERLLGLSEELPASAEALAGFSAAALGVFEALGEASGRGALDAFAGELEALGEHGARAAELLGALGLEQETLRGALNEAARAGETLRESLERGGAALEQTGGLAAQAGARYGTLGEEMEALRDRLEAVFDDFGMAADRGLRAAASGFAEMGAAADGATPSLLSAAAALLSVAAGLATVEQLLGKRSSNKVSVDTLGISSSLEKYQAMVKSAAGGLSAYAAGTGWARAGWALVGEQGPELVLMSGGERVLNATAAAGLLEEQAGSGRVGTGAGSAYYDNSRLTVQTSDDRVLEEIKGWWTHRRMRTRAQGGM